MVKNNRMLLIDEESLAGIIHELRHCGATAIYCKDEELKFPNMDDIVDEQDIERKLFQIREYLEIKRKVSHYERIIKPFIVNNEDDE